MKNILQIVFDLIFPQICLSCKEGIADKLFCKVCWDLLAPPDPIERCRHCFDPFDGEMCPKCKTEPEFCFPRARLFDSSPPAWILKGKMGEMTDALAGLSLIFWHRLGWELPDLVIPVPDKKGSKAIFSIARAFSKLLERPCIPAFRRGYKSFLYPEISLSKEINEGQSILLFDGESETLWLKSACERAADTFPKGAAILSLF